MLTSKQRAYLKAMANSIDAIFQVGKGGVPDTLIKQVDDALEVREIVKIRVLNNSPTDAKDAAQEIAHKTSSELVAVIGGRFVLYRKSVKEPKISLPI